MNVRKAAVQGIFYQADESRLRQDIDQFLEPDPPGLGDSPKVVIAPHAGFVYSGATAAAAYRCLLPYAATIKRVVVLGPAHRVYLQGMALPSVAAFSTPLGDIPLDVECMASIGELPGVSVDDEAHRLEHCIEVQLPFLQVVLEEFTLVPLVVGHYDPHGIGAVIDAVWGGRETLLVISTDLSHFHSYNEARQLDTITCERILARDNTLVGEDACGAQALNGLMSAGHSQTLRVQLLDMCNSGDTAGDRERVVGYGAFILY